MSQASLLAALREIETLDMDSAPCKTLVEYRDTLQARMREIAHVAIREHAEGGEPIDMILFCPVCHKQHVDAPEDGRLDLAGDEVWTNPPHKSHLCHGCGTIWRPADVPTNGVAAIKTRGEHDTTRAPDSAQGKPVAWLTVDQAAYVIGFCERWFREDGRQDVIDALEAIRDAAPPSEHVLPPLDAKVLRDLYDESVTVLGRARNFAETIYFINQVRSTLGMVLKLMTNADGVIERTPPSAPEPVAAFVRPTAWRRVRPKSVGWYDYRDCEKDFIVSRDNEGWEPLYAAPLPPAGRPVTPCTPKEAREIAAQAGWRADDCDQWWGETERGFTRPRTEDLMRFADAARGVKS